jgi:tRNA A-37 threonylcarbamoyl transferase component Bud32
VTPDTSTTATPDARSEPGPEAQVGDSTARRTRRRRRPSGAPPPLPRHIGTSGKLWLVASIALIVWSVITFVTEWGREVTNRADALVLRQIVRVRTDWLTDVMKAIDRAGSGWSVTGVFAAVIVALIVLKRWRHLFTFLGSFFALAVFGGLLYEAATRPRPYDVTIIGRWTGYSFPAAPAAVLATAALTITYTLVVPGRPRQMAKLVCAVVVGLFVVADLYLAIYHPFDILVGLSLAAAVTVNAYRVFTPNEVFPVTYRRGKTAHLDVGGRRGEAIRQAVQDQLGLIVRDIKPFGLEGSGGSTPLRLRVEGDPDTYLFAKLYSMTHVRADRWYKFGRTILYGRLEDEARFHSVRRLVQYEDYNLRLMRDAGVPTATPYGIVELTPEREYLLVTEFLEGAVEIGDATIDDAVIDEGLLLVRKLWNVGLAHRDIKPANLLVRDGHILVIDVAFAQAHPSPWRQAIDLANMMLVLAVRSDADRVYQRALQFFTPDEIAEAFAAARGIASPTQLRTAMKKDGRDLLAQFRAMAPARPPISLQRWNLRRVTLTIGLIAGLTVGAIVAGSATYDVLSPARDISLSEHPNCGTDNTMILMAQSVPSATTVPCLAALPAGWEFGGIDIDHNRGKFWLDSDEGGNRAVEATLLPPDQCDVDNATEVPSDEVGLRRFERVDQLPPAARGTRYYLFEGGCVTYEFDFDGEVTASLLFDADSALAFEPRAELVDEVDDRFGLRLCGAGVSCPGGS